MTCLEQLEVIGHSSATADAAVAHLMSFSHLVAGATKLTVLSVSFGKLPWFPPLVHVKHLVLSLGGDIDPGIVFAALPNANSLETLSLRTPNALLEAPLLQLDSMRFLCAVALEGICPAGINLPENCTMHLKGLLYFEIRGDAWDKAFNSVRTFCFEDNSLQIHDLIPTYFPKMQNLTTVDIMVLEMGTPDIYISLEGLSQVQRLYLGSECSYLKVPARVSWREVFFVSSEVMGLVFDDHAWFAKEVPNACFRYASLEGPSLLNLIRAWDKEQRCCKTKSPEDSRTCSVVSCCTQGYGMNFADCPCGVCMPCLRESGIAYRHKM